MAKIISGGWSGMAFDREKYKQDFNRLLNLKSGYKFFIRESQDTFKIKKFIQKAKDSFALANFVYKSEEKAKDYWAITIFYYSMLYIAKAAILANGYETDDHYATQIALGHLLVPTKLEAEDLELLNQTHRIFEDEYIEFFADARIESSTSKYSATKVYQSRRVKEILDNTNQFLVKLLDVLQEWQ